MRRALVVSNQAGRQGIIVRDAAGLQENLVAGVSLGATIGNAVPIPGVGTALGAGIGAIIGTGLSIFRRDKKEPAKDILRKAFYSALSSAIPGGVKMTGSIPETTVALRESDVENIVSQIRSVAMANFSSGSDDYDDMRSNFNSMHIVDADKVGTNYAILFFSTPVVANNNAGAPTGSPATNGGGGSGSQIASGFANVRLLGLGLAALVGIFGGK